MRRKCIFLCHKCSRCKLAVSFREGVSMHLAKLCYFTDQWDSPEIFEVQISWLSKKLPKLGGPSRKNVPHLISTFFTPGSHALSCPSYQVPRQIYLEILEKIRWEYRPNQLKWKQTMGNLKLTDEFTPENGCLEDKPFLLGRPIFRECVYY